MNQPDSNEENSRGGGTIGIGIIFRVADSLLNLDLLRDAKDEIKNVNWYILSSTAFYLGVIGFMLWILYVTLVFLMDYIISSQNLLAVGGRAFSAGTLAPAAILVVVFTVSVLFNRLDERVWSNDFGPPNQSWNLRLFVVSISALLGAVVMRGGIYLTATELLGGNVFQALLIGVMLVDLGYLSMLLIGFGGLGAFIFQPSTQSD